MPFIKGRRSTVAPQPGNRLHQSPAFAGLSIFCCRHGPARLLLVHHRCATHRGSASGGMLHISSPQP